MSEHYRRGDPEASCALSLLVIGLGTLLFWIILLAAIFDLGVFR